MAYLGFYFGGGGQNILEKRGYLHGYVLYCMLGGSGGMLPRENFKKWCNVVHFGEYFVKIW